MDAFKHLVFEGGGVRGIAYAGAIEVLESNGILNSIESVTGTSAGAITAGWIQSIAIEIEIWFV